MRYLKGLLLGLHLLVGFGALGGGWAAITDPLTPLGVPTELLQNSPFNDYFIPGLLLFAVIGLGNIASALLFFGSPIFQIYSSNIVSWALMIWIIVQVIMLSSIDSLHVIFFFVGLVQAFISFLQLYQRQLFPADILTNFSKKLLKKKV